MTDALIGEETILAITKMKKGRVKGQGMMMVAGGGQDQVIRNRDETTRMIEVISLCFAATIYPCVIVRGE
jgi:hypothetical protein